MLPGDGPLIQEPKTSDLVVAAEASTHKGRTILISKLFEVFRGWLQTATKTEPGLMTAEDKKKLDDLQLASVIEKISTEARREHAALIIRGASDGTVRMVRNLRNPGKIVRAYAETETGSFNLTVQIDGKTITGLSSLGVDDQGTGMVTIANNNTFAALSLIEAKISSASSNPAPANVTIGLLMEFNKPS